MDINAYAKLEGREFEYFMVKRRITIGRNSKQGAVDVNMGATRFISRKHLEISMEGNQFYLLCRGKNGVFVDDIFQRREAKRMQLPSSCIIRFASTQIKLVFTSLLEDNGSIIDARPSSPLPPSSAFQSPFITPVPSPTGTISVVNSCPASPNHPPRLHSIDLMASYASKLLSQQSEGRLTSDSEAGDDEHINNHPEEGGSQQPAESSGGSSPDNTMTREEEKNDEVTTIEGQDGEENNTNPDERIGKDGKKYTKPPYSYAQLIVQALLASGDRRQTLSSIYQFIAEKYPYYRLEDKGWKNSIRHNLSLNQYFMKAPREREGLGFGKGGYWCMHPDYEDKLTAQAYVKRKKKGIPVFPSAGLMSRSAPPSPTHHPFMADLNIKEHESAFIIRHAPPTTGTPHFTLPSFLPRLPHSASHSLPASPSRLPHGTAGGFPTHALRFYPLGIRSASTEALALESRQQQHHLRENEGEIPSSKRPRLSSDNDKLEAQQKPHPSLPKSVIIGPNQSNLIAPTAATLPCFPIAQPSVRFPFVGMPLLTQPSLLSSGSRPFIPSVQQAIVERDEQEEHKGETNES